MTNLFGEKDPRIENRYTIRIDKTVTDKARKKAESEGYSLAYLLKCFIAGYLSGEIIADTIIKGAKK